MLLEGAETAYIRTIVTTASGKLLRHATAGVRCQQSVPDKVLPVGRC